MLLFMRKLKDKDDVKLLVDEFYDRAKADELLGPIFAKAIDPNKWEHHVERIYSFWNTVLFGKKDYLGNPFIHHLHLPIEELHFERWTMIFAEVINEKFVGDKAEEAIDRANKMSLLFQSKLNYVRANPNSKPLM